MSVYDSTICHLETIWLLVVPPPWFKRHFGTKCAKISNETAIILGLFHVSGTVFVIIEDRI